MLVCSAWITCQRFCFLDEHLCTSPRGSLRLDAGKPNGTLPCDTASHFGSQTFGKFDRASSCSFHVEQPAKGPMCKQPSVTAVNSCMQAVVVDSLFGSHTPDSFAYPSSGSCSCEDASALGICSRCIDRHSESKARCSGLPPVVTSRYTTSGQTLRGEHCDWNIGLTLIQRFDSVCDSHKLYITFMKWFQVFHV